MGWHPCLRLYSDITNFTSISQDWAGELLDSTNSPILAPPTVVRQTGETASLSANNSPQLAGHPVPARIAIPKSSSEGSTPDMLVIVKRLLRAAGLLQDESSIAAHSRRPSTRKVYNSRLHNFFEWCKRQNHDPAITSLTAIGDFLVHLFKSGLAIIIITNSHSAIVAIHKGFPDGSSMSNNPTIAQLIEGMFVQWPTVRKLVPSWDLFQVLHCVSFRTIGPSLAYATVKQSSILTGRAHSMGTSWRTADPEYEIINKKSVRDFLSAGYIHSGH